MYQVLIVTLLVSVTLCHAGGLPYSFAYRVADDDYGTYASQRESFDGAQVKGSYSTVEEGGVERTVTYTADDENGYQAEVVRKLGNTVIEKFVAGPLGTVVLVGDTPQPQPQVSYKAAPKVIKIVKSRPSRVHVQSQRSRPSRVHVQSQRSRPSSYKPSFSFGGRSFGRTKYGGSRKYKKILHF